MSLKGASLGFLAAGCLIAPNTSWAAPMPNLVPELEAAREAEVKGDWATALLCYEDLYDLATTDQNKQAALSSVANTGPRSMA